MNVTAPPYTKPLLALATGLLLIVAGVLVAAAETQVTLQDYQGDVIAVAPGQLTVMMGTAQHKFLVTDKTQVFINGGSGKLEDIRQGFTARVKAERLGKQLIAHRIDAKEAAVVTTGF